MTAGGKLYIEFRITGTVPNTFLRITGINSLERDVPFTTGEWVTAYLTTATDTKLYFWVGTEYAADYNYTLEIRGVSYGDGLVSDHSLLLAGAKMVNDMAKRKTEVSKIVLPTVTPYLPPIYAVVGRECNIYFDNIIADSSSFYDIDVSCNVGVQQRERWTYTPSSARTDNITIRFIDKRTGVIVGSATSTVTAVAVSAGSGNPKVIAIGDSTTSGMQVIGELKTLMDADGAMDVTLVGSQGTTHKHEGYSGWKVADFMVSGSPFYRGGVVDFSAYISDLGLAGCDIAVIHLGINDIFGQSTDYACDQIANIAKGYLDTLITSIKTYNSSVKIGIAVTIPPSASQDAFGASYNCVEPWYRHKRNLVRWWNMLITGYGSRTAESIYLVPYNTALDTEHNMSKATAAAWNSRTSETTARQNNGVHPADIGYYQLADVLYAWIKAIS